MAAISAATTPTPNSFLLKSTTSTTQIATFPTTLSRSFTAATTVHKRITCSSTTLQTPASTVSTTSLDRVFNFVAGPAILPENVLLKAQSELYNWRGSGMSVMETSHCGKEFLSIIQKAESDLWTLLNIPKNYSVLFLQGGATTQFSAVCKSNDPVDYIVTGSWRDKAFKEVSKYCKPKTIWILGKTPIIEGDKLTADKHIVPKAKISNIFKDAVKEEIQSSQE
ncbi:Phosphoserine aminotransferase 2 [Forsythia ovata]|uniref:Phosphoserine aminotransferase 2 n=1 Tax=Forsythia ovata TaxID=205694 RepID=A0ABD1RME2_9LAMI